MIKQARASVRKQPQRRSRQSRTTKHTEHTKREFHDRRSVFRVLRVFRGSDDLVVIARAGNADRTSNDLTGNSMMWVAAVRPDRPRPRIGIFMTEVLLSVYVRAFGGSNALVVQSVCLPAIR